MKAYQILSILLSLTSVAIARTPDTPQCREFASYSTRAWESTSDALLVARDGKILFEHYGPEYGPDQPHNLWSAAKTVTGALFGAAIRDGRLAFDQKISEFYPRDAFDANYEKIALSNIFYADAGFVWDESSFDVAKNNVIQMLFGSAREDMATYVSQQKIHGHGPGYRWQYNTGAPNILQGALKQALGDDYEAYPWKTLFNPLGMKDVIMEQDNSGVFVGGSYMFATPRDMLKLGQLYVQRGAWNGQQLLPEDWIDKTLTISPGYMAPGTTDEQIIKSHHLVYGGLIWLNRSGRPWLPRPFPGSPGDMFMFLGRSGQFILGIPSKKMVLVRTGYGTTIDYRIDGIVTRALACFDDPKTPIADLPPAPLHKGSGPTIRETVSVLRKGLRAGLVQGAIAKWVCTCHFVSRLPVRSCLKRGDVPHAEKLISVRVTEDRIEVRPRRLLRILTGARAARTAVRNLDNPQLGCRLL